MSKKEINKVSPYGSTLLQAAVHSNSTEKVVNILGKKADPNITQKPTGETALHRAVLNKNLDIIRLLLGAKAEIDTCGLYGSSLHLAAVRDIDITEGLIQNGATVDLRNSDNITPLYTAAFGKRFDIVKLLCKHQADINQHAGDNETIFHAALKNNNDSIIIQEILQLNVGANPNLLNEKGETLLHLCGKYYNTMKSLLESNADPNIQNEQGNTPLHLSVHWDWEFTQILMENGSNLELRNELGETPLMSAAIHTKKRLQEMVGHPSFRISSKIGRKFAKELQANEKVSEEVKDFITELQEKQKPRSTIKKRKKTETTNREIK